MQIWLYFIGGAGGDSVANLLEQAYNVEPVDGNLEWRLSHYIDGLACWWAPCFDREQCFRSARPFPFRTSTNATTARYRHLVEHDIPTVITSHDVMLNEFNASDDLDLLSHKQIKVLVKYSDPIDSFRLCQLKNFAVGTLTPDPVWREQVMRVPDHFDHVLDVTRCHHDWLYTKEFCDNIGVDLCFDTYKQWQDLLHWHTSFLKDKVKSWQSQQQNGHVIGYVPSSPSW